MMRRGFVFTLDAILALVLVIIFVSSIAAIAGQSGRVYSTYAHAQNKYTAESVLSTLRTTPLQDLVPAEVIENWTEEGILNTSIVNPSMSPIDIAATYWATGPIYNQTQWRHDAEIILGYILNNTLKGYDYEMMINNYTSPYLQKLGANASLARDVSPATLLLSGYAYNQTPRGYMARAYLSKVSYTHEDLFGWFRVLAGPYNIYGKDNVLTLTRLISLPNDTVTITADAKFARRRSEYQTLEINDNSSCTYGPVSSTINANITKCIIPGVNNFTTMYFNPTDPDSQDGIGSASGTTVYVKYTSNSVSVRDPGNVKIYRVDSKYTGFFYLLEMFVPGEVNSINMKFTVSGVQKVNLYYGLGGNLTLLLSKAPQNGVVEFTDSEIHNAVDNVLCNGADCYAEFKENLSKMVFDFVVGFDAKFNKDTGRWEYGGAKCYGIYCTLDRNVGRRTLYEYPASYVKVSYIPETLISPYSIPLSVYFPYGDSRVTYRGGGLQVKYTLPLKATPWYADWWVGYHFRDYSTYQELYENGKRFYRGPLGRYAIRVAYTRLYPWMMVNGSTNTFEIKMTDGSSYIRDGETRGIIKYFIQGYVGYGDIFPYMLQGAPAYKGYNLTYWYDLNGVTKSSTIVVGDPPYKDMNVTNLNPFRYAVDDAILRLFNRLNYKNDENPGVWKKKPYDGSRDNPIDMHLSSNIHIEVASMGNIPGLFSPITITLRVWREKP